MSPVCGIFSFRSVTLRQLLYIMQNWCCDRIICITVKIWSIYRVSGCCCPPLNFLSIISIYNSCQFWWYLENFGRGGGQITPLILYYKILQDWIYFPWSSLLLVRFSFLWLLRQSFNCNPSLKIWAFIQDNIQKWHLGSSLLFLIISLPPFIFLPPHFP